MIASVALDVPYKEIITPEPFKVEISKKKSESLSHNFDSATGLSDLSVKRRGSTPKGCFSLKWAVKDLNLRSAGYEPEALGQTKLTAPAPDITLT